MLRTGIRIIGSRGRPEVRDALIRYARWLRKNYEFPIRVPIYLFPGESILTSEGKTVSASFVAPYDRNEEPFVRIATGDFETLMADRSRDDVLAAYIVSLSHELVHYFQWVKTGEVTERNVNQKAYGMLREYSKDVDHP